MKITDKWTERVWCACRRVGRENYFSVFTVFPICLTWVLVNRLDLRLSRQSGVSRTVLAFVS